MCAVGVGFDGGIGVYFLVLPVVIAVVSLSVDCECGVFRAVLVAIAVVLSSALGCGLALPSSSNGVTIPASLSSVACNVFVVVLCVADFPTTIFVATTSTDCCIVLGIAGRNVGVVFVVAFDGVALAVVIGGVEVDCVVRAVGGIFIVVCIGGVIGILSVIAVVGLCLELLSVIVVGDVYFLALLASASSNVGGILVVCCSLSSLSSVPSSSSSSTSPWTCLNDSR